MNFNKLINSILKEEEIPSREARAQAMKNLGDMNDTEELEEYYFELESIFTDSQADEIESWQVTAVKELFSRLREERGNDAVINIKDMFSVKTDKLIDQENSPDMADLYRDQVDIVMNM